MRKATFVALSALLVASACKQSPEATHGVDTTLNDADTETVQENVLNSSDAIPSPEVTEPIEDTSTEAGGTDVSDMGQSDDPFQDTETTGGDRSRAATPTLDPSYWVTADDYPPAAQRAGEQGSARIKWDISETGRVENCTIVDSSGSTFLDDASCRVVTRRGRYSPALNSSGEAVRSTGSRRITWTLPE